MKRRCLQNITIGFLLIAAAALAGCNSWRATVKEKSSIFSSALFDSDQAAPDQDIGSFTAPKAPTHTQQFTKQCKDIAKKTGQIVMACTLYTSAYLLQGWWDGLLDTEDSNKEINRLWHQGYGYNNPNPQRQREGKKPLDF